KERAEGPVAGEGGGVIGHMPGAIGEDDRAAIALAAVPGAAAFFAHEGEVPDVALDVGDEGGLDLHDGAVVEANLADGQVLDGIRGVVPAGPHAGDFAGLI